MFQGPFVSYGTFLFMLCLLLFQFKKLLMESSLASQFLNNELTVFAPSDAAMAKYNGLKDDQFILNHMGMSSNSIVKERTKGLLYNVSRLVLAHKREQLWGLTYLLRAKALDHHHPLVVLKDTSLHSGFNC